MKRRDFLAQTGLILTALGVSETGLPSWASRYQQALAQPTRRKLALLIGIDQYPDTVIDTPGVKAALRGCTTDVSLQRELLIHRFGFEPVDILTLINAQATRQDIVQAFIEHLCKQAQAGDTVVLHFSGYGGQLRLENSETTQSQPPVMSWVPVDGVLPTESKPAFKDLLEADVRQLLKLIKTRQLTTILDAGFSDAAGLSASFRSRARPVIPTGAAPRPVPVLTNFFEQVGKPEVPALFPGLLLRAARPEQPVVERAWDEFSAGLFTYALTRYLWSATPATKIYTILGRTRETVSQWVPQQLPMVAGKRQPEVETLYDGASLIGRPADAVVSGIATDGRTANIWLGGLSAEIVQYTGTQSWLQTVDPNGEPGLKVQLRSRNGLKAKARWPDGADGGWFRGQRLYETIRILPKNVNLVVALDNSLERIERVDATSALSSLPFVSSLSTAEQPADCLFGKTLAVPEAALTASLVTTEQVPVDPEESYGLFLPTHQLIPGTLVKQDEAIKAAITRLTPRLQTILAMKLLRLTENQSSSQMPVRINLEMVAPQEKLLQQRETLRSSTSLPRSRLAGLMSKQERPLNLNLRSRIRYRLFNFGQTPLYFMLISLDGRERPNAFFPTLSVTNSSEAMLAAAQEKLIVLPGQSVNVPQADTNWSIEKPAGSIDTYAVFSYAPFTETIKTLLPLAGSSTGQRINLADNALEVMQALLSDLSNQSNASSSVVSDVYALDVSTWATLNISFQSV